MAEHLTCASAPLNHCIDLSFSKLFEHCGENEEEGIPWVLQNLITWEKERRAKPLMNEIRLVVWVLRRTLALIQIGSTLSSARAICRFLKKLSKTICFARSCEDLCGIALEIVQPRITLSLETRPLSLQTLNLGSECSTVNHNVGLVWPDLKQPLN